MKITSFNKEIDFKKNKISTSVVLETTFSKEIRIILPKQQIMKEHKAPFPIVVHVLEGSINFGVNGTKYDLKQGDIISLSAQVPHDLEAYKNSVVRLTLSKKDSVHRLDELVTAQ